MLATKKYKQLAFYQLTEEKRQQVCSMMLHEAIEEKNLLELAEIIVPNLEGEIEIDITIKYQNVYLDQTEPEEPEEPEAEGPTAVDVTYILGSQMALIADVAGTDEAFYGDNFDGVDRKKRLYWIDTTGAEHEVPLNGIDTYEPVNPNGRFTYYSEGNYIQFEQFVIEPQTYILKEVE